jgi:tetratricopeptide (TPR) repeat protein
MSADEEMRDAEGAREDGEETRSEEEDDVAANDVSDDSDDSEEEEEDDDSEEEEDEFELPDDKQLEAVMELERACEASDWSDYSKMLRLIDSCREARLRERYKDTLERYCEKFALDERRWTEWIQEELQSRTEAKRVRHERCDTMFERAIADCGRSSVRLHLGRSRNAMELEVDESGRRELYEEGVAGPGLNFIDGHLIWQAYRAFEMSRGNEPSHNARVKALFLRQLRIPHAQNAATLAAAKTWATTAEMDASTIRAFEEAHAKGEKDRLPRQPFEARLVTDDNTVRTDAQALRTYLNYIDFENASGTPDRVVHLYERALSALPYVGELWRDYHIYAIGLTYGKKCGEETLAPKVLDRALRTCPSSSALWTFALEFDASPEILERVKNAYFRDVNDYATVLHAVIELLIRQGDWDHVVERLKAGFQHMIVQYSANNMARAAIYMLKEIVQFVFMSDPKNRPYVQDVFSSVEKEVPFRTAAEFHTLYAEYLAMVKRNNPKALQVLNDAIQRGDSEPIGLSKKTVDESARRRAGMAILVNAKLRHLSMVGTAKGVSEYSRYFKSTGYTKELREHQMEAAIERLEANDAKTSRMMSGSSRRNRAAARRQDADSVPRKRTRDVPADGDKADMNLKGMEHEDRIRALFPDRDLNTAFVKNVSWDVSEAELAGFFDGKGGSVRARIVLDKDTGRPRGFAYVDFSEEAALSAAIMRSGAVFKGRPLDIAKSRPPGDGGRGAGAGGRGRGRGRRAPPPPTFSGGRGRGGLGFMPRSVRAEREPVKTNADFRALFMKAQEGKQ